MNLRRVGILFLKEVVQGPKNYIFIMALVMPVVITLLVTLVFGSYFSGKGRLGLVDQGSSSMPLLAGENQALSVRAFDSEAALKDAVSRGAIDIGLVLPAGFDQQVRDSEQARVTIYIWGESQLQHRIILSAAVIGMVRQIAGQETPVEIVQTVLGSTANIPWEQRLLPLMVLMTVLVAGTMVPSTSLVMEKSKRTLSALAVSPATLLEIFAAKGLLGVVLGMAAGIMILFLNRSFGNEPLLLLGVLLLGTTFASAFGVALGALVKDINTLFATIKGLGLLLYAPGIVYMFPEIPQWIARVFPTYYALQPVLDISQNNAGLREIWPDLAVLLGLIALMFVILVGLAQRTQEAEAAA
jgi:ABC-2 type transport system permease protein